MAHPTSSGRFGSECREVDVGGCGGVAGVRRGTRRSGCHLRQDKIVKMLRNEKVK